LAESTYKLTIPFAPPKETEEQTLFVSFKQNDKVFEFPITSANKDQ